MPASSPILPAILSVLDRADETEALTRERLLASAKAAGTAHAAEVLEEAVDWHLAQVIPSVTPPQQAYDFGWNRPKTKHEQARRVKRWAWLDWLERPGLATLGMLGLAVLLDWPTAWCLHAHAQDVSWGMSIIVSSIPAVMVSCLSFLFLAEFTGGRQAPRTLTGDLEFKVSDYLDHKTSRAYLRAVLSSDLPELLEGDAWKLNVMVKADRELKRKALREENAARHQAEKDAESRRERETRMARFAQGLRESDYLDGTPP